MNINKNTILILFIALTGCGIFGPEKTLWLEDSDNTEGVKVTMRQKGQNKVIETRVTNGQGVATFKGRYAEGKTYVFNMQKDGRKAQTEYTIDENESWKLPFTLDSENVKSVRFSMSQKLNGVKIFGLKGKKKKELGIIEDGELVVVINKKQWGSISFSGNHPDANIGSKNLNKGFMYDEIPAQIVLSAYPKKSFFPMLLVDSSNRPLSNVKVICDQLGGKEWSTNTKGLVKPIITSDEMESAGILLNDKITFRINSSVYENKTQTFFANTKKYNRDGNQKKITLEKGMKAIFMVVGDNGKAITSSTVYADGKNIGKTDRYGKITFDYKDNRVDQTISVKAFKKRHEPKERSIKLSAKTGRTYTFRLVGIKPVSIMIVDDESDEVIENKEITIDGKRYKTNSYGLIDYEVDSNVGKVDYNYSGEDVMHYARSGDLEYDISNRTLEIRLLPQTVLVVNSFYRNISSTDTLPNVVISIDGKRKGKTDERGSLIIPITEDQRKNGLKIEASKKGFELYSHEDLRPTSKRHSKSITLRAITGKFVVRDVRFNAIGGVEVVDDNDNIFKTDRYGYVSVRLDAFDSQLTFTFKDPKGHFQTKTETVVFKNKDKKPKEITLIREPIELDVRLSLGGIPAKGKIFITPPPDPKKETSGYRLKVGSSKIPIYNPGRYRVRYETRSPVVTGDTTINITTDSRTFVCNFGDIPLSATFKAIVDDGQGNIDISVYLASNYSGSKKVLLKKIKGDGSESFDHPDAKYGTDLVLTYKRPGWNKRSEERITLDKPNQTFRFVVGDNYAVCKELESKRDYNGACEACLKVEKASSDYCDSRQTLRDIYRNKLKQYEKALSSEWAFIQTGQCINTYTDYIIMFELASKSKMRKVPKKLRDPNLVIRFFDEAKDMIILQVQRDDRDEMENSLKQFTSAYSVELIEYLIDAADSEVSGERAEGFEQDAKLLYEYMNDRFVAGLPSGLRGQYLDRATTLIRKIQ